MSEQLQAKFQEAGQGHVFRFFDELTPEGQASLISQAEAIDLDELTGLIDTLVLGGGENISGFGDMKPAPFIPLPENGGDPEQWAQAGAIGEEVIRAGRVAAFTPAGGQGTRLGYDGPKGTFEVTPVAKNTLFQVFAEKILAASKRYEVEIPWYIMTSTGNHDATVSFFEENNYFGLKPGNVKHFAQGTMPAVDFEGKILMSDKGQIALSPDGHGGSMRALVRNGAVADMKARGIDCVAFFQVDNPLVRCIHPEFIGFHVQADSELSNKACVKSYAAEKVGVFVERNGKTEILEYSDLPDSLAEATDADGNLLYRAGSIAIHVFSLDLIERIGTNADPNAKLPFHRANKKIPTIDESGNPVEPGEPNGVKFEMFGFDALPFAKNPVVIETARAEEFSPVKNAEGVDSPESSKKDQLRQFARWAKAAGIEIETDETGLPAIEFEVSPLFATSAAQLAERVKAEGGVTIEQGTVLT
ncbi:MAG: UDPGP type 1 family protein [Verrucomicrobiales bacterium]|nr:UDPGP type 1 family protein [Verrucomicrobiales bacterium]